MNQLKSQPIVDELRRLTNGVSPSEERKGIEGVLFSVMCTDCALTLDRARAVLAIVDKSSIAEWPDLATWVRLLPTWFVDACHPERTSAQRALEAERVRTLDARERVEEENHIRWELSSWIYWFRPENREWYYWDAEEAVPGFIHVDIDAYSSPCPFGSLEWLFRAAGAHEILPL